ncbi:MAG: T9SS type A sorting domain-containing protein [Bacteroidia bacterium]|nr:T9SS type A sorting domain-containing protein [Bacteroidia bacterium]MCX7763683.1 T9SS type A sorting domain-containing protein [Bacteroidia bacterium]MDW8057036.1 T9SS type A sorting domain-containing protein [Bacteroidia bacterium]
MDNDTLEVSLQAGETYYLLAESASPGCLRFDSLTISRISTTSITEERFPLALEVYPNPTSDALHLRGYHLTTEPILLTLWSVTGEKVQEHTFYPQASRWEMTLSLHHLPSGLYVLQVMQGERQKQFRIHRLPY